MGLLWCIGVSDLFYQPLNRGLDHSHASLGSDLLMVVGRIYSSGEYIPSEMISAIPESGK